MLLEWVSIFTHELRNPLYQIQGISEILKSEAVEESDDKYDLHDWMNKAAKRTEAVFNEFFLIAFSLNPHFKQEMEIICLESTFQEVKTLDV